MAEKIWFEFRYNSHIRSGHGRLVRMDDRGPVIVDAETGAEFLVPWVNVMRGSKSQPAPHRQKTLFGDE